MLGSRPSSPYVVQPKKLSAYVQKKGGGNLIHTELFYRSSKGNYIAGYKKKPLIILSFHLFSKSSHIITWMIHIVSPLFSPNSPLLSPLSLLPSQISFRKDVALFLLK